MRIEEAKQIYRSQIKDYYARQRELADKKEELAKKNGTTENEAAILELQYNAVNKKRQEYQNYMDKLQEQWACVANMVSGQQEADAMAEAANEQGKIMEVARRIMRGDKVPPYDEKKLMEYDWKLYSMAKSAAAMVEIQKKRKAHKSLWEDEEKKEYADPIEEANNTEAFSTGPEVVDVDATMSNATAGFEPVETDVEI